MFSYFVVQSLWTVAMFSTYLQKSKLIEVLQPKFPDVLFLMTINLLLSKPVKKNLKQLDNAYVFFKNYFRQIELICQVSGSEFKST